MTTHFNKSKRPIKVIQSLVFDNDICQDTFKKALIVKYQKWIKDI